jgi:hypothetical protein|tara:strand:- start:255 stop:863 length:609 start_codon:yes stop_codon:yes gene_type:complete
MDKRLYKALIEQKNEDLGDAPEGGVKAVSTETKARKADDSVDDQIDSLILLYEKRAIRDEEDRLMESLNKTSLKYLFEQEEEATDEGEPEAEEETAEPSGSEKVTATIAKKDAVPDLDIDKFTIKVARLIMNHRQLLDVENAVINRTKNFLDENYGDTYVVRYLNILEEQFGLSPKEFDIEYAEDVPLAVGANPAGAGMSGG